MSGHPTQKLQSRVQPRPAFPFAAIVGQAEMKLALLLNVIAPSVGGVLVTGHRGTGKSTAVRALADLLPPHAAARGCAYGCDPRAAAELCEDCRARLSSGAKLQTERRPVAVVDLPLGATEDRVCGAIDFGRAVREGVRAFEPGLLARAHRGFLYVDEVNLLEDHLVDLLLDVAATGVNRVEREGVSAEHPARFVLVGSANPEEGELRPQLLDRFGLCVEVETARDVDERVRIVERREAFERDPAAFAQSVAREQDALRRRLLKARRLYPNVELPRALLRSVAELCLRLEVDGHRGELTIARAARALAAFEGRKRVGGDDVRRVASMSLRHRLRRDPFEQTGGAARVEELAEELFGDEAPRGGRGAGGRGGGEGPASSDHSAGNGQPSTRRREPEAARAPAGPEADGAGSGREEKVLPPADAPTLPNFSRPASTDEGGRRRASSSSTSAARRRAGARKSAEAARGRYARASASAPEGARRLAADATLRAAVLRRPTHAGPAARLLELDAEDLRFKRFRAKAGTLYVFAVDTSGSMALNRIGQAKGALARLLRRSYVNRDRVALVTFRGREAQTLLRPCGAPALARRLLEALPVGGATPLAAGLRRALEVARRSRAEGAVSVRLVLFTDGRANVAAAPEAGTGKDAAARRQHIEDELARLASALRAAGVASTVVDTQPRFTSRGEARALAHKLGGEYVLLPANPVNYSPA